MPDQRWTCIPWHMDRTLGDVIALEAGNRHCGKIAYADAVRKCGVFGNDCVIFRLIIGDQVHLVHRKNNVFYAQ